MLQIETSLRQPSARLGCGAAIVDRNRLLLIKRRKNPEAGYWGLPGGKVDPSEDIEAAVRREIAEELGIELALQRLLRLTQFVDAGSGDLWVAPVLLASVRSGMPQINEPQALAELAWFALDRLPTPLTAATIQAMEALDE